MNTLPTIENSRNAVAGETRSRSNMHGRPGDSYTMRPQMHTNSTPNLNPAGAYMASPQKMGGKMPTPNIGRSSALDAVGGQIIGGEEHSPMRIQENSNINVSAQIVKSDDPDTVKNR